MTRPKVKIVGGGIAGLTAALYAARGGAQVELFEAVSELGGRSRSRVEQGFHFNMGPHALYRSGPAARILQELDIHLNGSVVSSSGALALRNGTLHALPTGSVSLLSTGLLGVTEKTEFARILMRLQKLRADAYTATSFSDWLMDEIQSPRVRDVIAAMTRLTSYTHAPGLMSAEAAIKQLQIALGGGVRYLDRGWGQMVDALAAEAKRSGVEIHRSQRVRRLEISEDNVIGLRLDDDHRIATTSVILALGPHEASALVSSGADPKFAAWADALPVRAACFSVGLSKLPRPRNSFVLGIDEPTYFSVHSRFANVAPHGGALIDLLRYLTPDEKPERSKLQKNFEDTLDLLQPEWRESLVCKRLLSEVRVTHRLVTAEAGGLSGRPEVKVDHLGGLYIAGDWVGPEGLLADASFASGKAAAKRACEI